METENWDWWHFLAQRKIASGQKLILLVPRHYQCTAAEWQWFWGSWRGLQKVSRRSWRSAMWKEPVILSLCIIIFERSHLSRRCLQIMVIFHILVQNPFRAINMFACTWHKTRRASLISIDASQAFTSYAMSTRSHFWSSGVRKFPIASQLGVSW